MCERVRGRVFKKRKGIQIRRAHDLGIFGHDKQVAVEHFEVAAGRSQIHAAVGSLCARPHIRHAAHLKVCSGTEAERRDGWRLAQELTPVCVRFTKVYATYVRICMRLYTYTLQYIYTHTHTHSRICIQ